MASLAVYVCPRSSDDAVLGWRQAPDTGLCPELSVRLRAAPTDGKANDALIRLLARELRVPKSGIVIKSGHASRHKLLQIAGEQSALDTVMHNRFGNP
jgi:uncharacterized protein (TIGR00251 family)